ncbi:DUF4347 domain-containing protein [Shewanella violacea]|uniref:DUF4347 domain-containing protein n=1 Tax=Shewanella violacea (strain JCM 10179 / CIP 106290 / LMG 19151 / DSS12) TaxID=637905 RepID=D4ZFR7_SHEVD|nr:DUF4347 domain-containing protein [Shewanella violacea]BAJ00516.1 hypothetical protein SVI_0545 [Shewanella violacea DSS12]
MKPLFCHLGRGWVPSGIQTVSDLFGQLVTQVSRRVSYSRFLTIKDIKFFNCAGIVLASLLVSPLAHAELTMQVQVSRELIIMDLSVHDPKMLVEALNTKFKQHAGHANNTKIFFLKPNKEPLLQIKNAIEATANISHVSIVSHASNGALFLSERWVDKEYISARKTLMLEIGDLLQSGTDLNLYGCNQASGRLERSFVDILAKLTSLDVAASIDITGELSEGRNWELGYRVRDMEVASQFNIGMTKSVHQP